MTPLFAAFSFSEERPLVAVIAAIQIPTFSTI